MLDSITPVVLTRNEAPNIGRTLAQLRWAREVLVVDSLSTDDTLKIARAFPNVRVIQRPFDDLATQWIFAMRHVDTPWVLALDADYFVPEAFITEVAALEPDSDVSGYEVTFRYAVAGRPLRASLYPPHPVLVRRDRTTFAMDGHAHRVRVTGCVIPLNEPIIHDDRKSLGAFIHRQRRYMREEAHKLRTTDSRQLKSVGRIRKWRVIAPLVIVPYVLFFKGLILDGRAGLHYAFERFLAEVILSWELTFGPR